MILPLEAVKIAVDVDLNPAFAKTTLPTANGGDRKYKRRIPMFRQRGHSHTNYAQKLMRKGRCVSLQ